MYDRSVLTAVGEKSLLSFLKWNSTRKVMMERNSNDATSLQPTLCTNGCGFFGTAATEGLCSKCYRDLTIQENEAAQAKSAVGKSWSLKTGFKALAVVEKADEGFAWGVGMERKVEKKRCEQCNKKVGLTGFQCRCGNTFCGSHRYAEEHDCEFDFKAKGRREIAEANPVVKPDKLDRL